MRNQMTSEQAKTFETYSVKNAMILTMKCSKCQPYKDWFTYARWRAQGWQVQKGEKGTRIGVVKYYDVKDEETNEVETKQYLGTASVFCRHQVKKKS